MRALLIVFLLGLAAPAMAAAPWRGGTWFGKGQPGDAQQFWLSRQKADGAYQMLGRRCDKGKAVDSVESGRWTASNGVTEIVTTRVDGVAAHYVDRYQLISFDGHTRREKHVWANYAPADGIKGYVFSSVLVPDGFRLPGCEAVS